MSRRTNKKRYIAKASNEAAAVGRLRMGEMGTIALSKIRADSENMKVLELRWPQFIDTVEAMKQDATVAMALDTKYTFVEKAFKTFKVLNSGTEASKSAAEFVDYCLRNMDGQTLRQFARSAATFNEFGFSVVEKIYTQIQTGEYAGMMKVKKLAFRPQGSLDRTQPFIFGDESREFLGVRQSSTAFINARGYLDLNTIPLNSVHGAGLSVLIPANKVMVMTLGGSESNMAGVSPLVGCYRAFREKVLIENLEVIGATKDFGGILELKIPSQILNKANIDPTSPEAEMVRGLMKDAANAHAGDQSFFVLPSDIKEGSPQYSMTLKGIDGSGKQYNTQDLINSRKKAILDSYGAGFMNLGNDKGGSHNLSESKQTIHSHFVERDNEIILEALNDNLIPQLLALNGIRLSQKDMPVVQSGLIIDIDMESFSKFVQRCGSSGYLPRTPRVINKILEVGGFDDYQLDEDMPLDDLLEILGEVTSNAGEGMAPNTTGNGTSTRSARRDNSVSNMEN